jgi:sugar lactone lactonase YvrE
MKGFVWRLLFWLAFVTGGAMVLLFLAYGGGERYRDLSGTPLFSSDALETVVRSPEPVGNVAVSASGRLFYTIHPESRPSGAKLLEWIDGRARPYPSEEAQALFDTPLGVAIDSQNRLWTIDHGTHGTRKVRLLAFDLATDELVHDHVFDSEVAQLGSFLQDLQIDPSGEHVFIADASVVRKNPGIVVYDIEDEKARRVLDSDPSVSSQSWVIRNQGEDVEFFGGLITLKPGVDGIALDRAGKWLYYGAMAHDTLYRIAVEDLLDDSLGPEALAARIEAVGPKPLNDGLSTDNAGNVLITDVEHNAVLRMAPDGSLKTLIRSEDIRWPDALSYGPDGWLYVADSALTQVMLHSKAHIRSQGPYGIFRFKPGIEAAAGQ